MHKNRKWFSFLFFFQAERKDIFYLEKKPRLNSIHILHGFNCELLPERSGRIGLGNSPKLYKAMLKAQSLFPQVKICKQCIGKM